MKEPKEIAPGLACLLIGGFVNVYFVGEKGGPWAVVDSGIAGSSGAIKAAAEARFGEDAPEAIYLTHGHTDHAGSALDLAAYWNVPVYVHKMELPYLTGQSDYPPKDPTTGGAIGFMSRFFSTEAMDLGAWVKKLPSGALPGMDGWEAVETPGHSPGHISFFRAADKTLIAGDAFTTVDLQSAAAIATGAPKICPPPLPFTCDWQAVRKSWNRLDALKPELLAAGHGSPISGPGTAEMFARFVDLARIPGEGRYVPEPAKYDETGVTFVPPAPPDNLPKVAAGVIVGAGVALGLGWAIRQARASGKRK